MTTFFNHHAPLSKVFLAALICFSFSTTAKAQQPGPKVELHNQLSSLLEDVSGLERKLGNIPTTKKQRKKLNNSISKLRRKISRLMAVTPSHVRRFDPNAKKMKPAPQALQVAPKMPKPAPAAPQAKLAAPQVQVAVQKSKPAAVGTPKVSEKPKPKLPKAMGKKAFSSLLRSVAGESFASGKLQVLKSAAPHHHFNINQVTKLLSKFSFSGEKLKVVRILYPKVVDPKNSFKLYKAFTFESDKRKLRGIIDG